MLATMASPTPPPAEKRKTMVVFDQQTQDLIDDDIYRGVREGRYPRGYNRSAWLMEAARERLERSATAKKKK